jgi:hypothetical protein
MPFILDSIGPAFHITKETDVEETSPEMERFERISREVIQAVTNAGGGSNSVAKIYINAGGIGTLALLLIAAFILGVTTFNTYSSASRINDLERRQDRQDDYLQAIYAVAPQLKPKEAKQ